MEAQNPKKPRRHSDNDEVFEKNSQPPTPKTPRRTPTTSRRSPREGHERRTRSSERRTSSRSAHRTSSCEAGPHGASTKTDLIRASAKRAEQKRKLSGEHKEENHHHHHHHHQHHQGSRSSQKSSFSSENSPHKKSPVHTSRRQSVAVIEQPRHNHSDVHNNPQPKRSHSTSPKHKPVSATNSKSSLLGKQSPGTSSPLRNYASLIEASQTRSLASQLLLPHSRSSGYSKPAMEVAVAALVFGAGAVTLIISLIIGSNAWMIVGAISMGIGGVFIFFGACFYISRHKRYPDSEEFLEVRIVDQKQLAELSNEGFKVRAVMDM